MCRIYLGESGHLLPRCHETGHLQPRGSVKRRPLRVMQNTPKHLSTYQCISRSTSSYNLMPIELGNIPRDPLRSDLETLWQASLLPCGAENHLGDGRAASKDPRLPISSTPHACLTPHVPH